MLMRVANVWKCQANFLHHAAFVKPAVIDTWWNDKAELQRLSIDRKYGEFSPEEMRP